MENLLRTYTRLKKKEKKGFTLVELLVVIAILAVLASVSVVGYLGFTTKAKNSDAVTELAQVREVLRAELIDGKEHEFHYADSVSTDGATNYNKSYKMKYVEGDYYFLDLSSNTDIVATTDSLVIVTSQFTISKELSDLSGLKAEIKVKLTAATKDVGGSSESGVTDYKIDVMSYKRNAGGAAYWTIKGDKIDTGEYAIPTSE